jgi:hypothetical protein
VNGGRLARRLEIPPGVGVDGEQLARLGELLNLTVELMGSLVSHVNALGERLSGEPSGQELRAVVRRLRELTGRYEL